MLGCAGAVSPGEVDSLWKVCDTNEDAVAELRAFYHL